MLQLLHQRNAASAPARLKQLQQVAVANGNLFAELMETVKYCSLGQITDALFEVGGQYRRNMRGCYLILKNGPLQVAARFYLGLSKPSSE